MKNIIKSTCIACGAGHAAAIFDGVKMPLSTLAFPETEEQAINLPKLDHDYVRCLECGHIYNSSFKYEDVPYTDTPYNMYNKGRDWSEALGKISEKVLSYLPENPRVVEIGHGDGSFLTELSVAAKTGTFFGFDPHGAVLSQDNLRLSKGLFLPEKHFAELKPDLVVIRHVAEHLENPLHFMQELCIEAALGGRFPVIYIEVPGCDNVIKMFRHGDFYYEHCSLFTSGSLEKMLQNIWADTLELGSFMKNEVIYGVVRVNDSKAEMKKEAEAFSQSVHLVKSNVKNFLLKRVKAGKKVVIWGGTGKASSFLNVNELDKKNFPFVVDSNISRVGSFVPGMGQKIRSIEDLRTEEIDDIVIAATWRASEIVFMIEEMGLTYENIFTRSRSGIVKL